MKSTVFVPAILTLFLHTASGWRLQLYRDEAYQVPIVDRSGTNGQPCKNLSGDLNDKVSSMKWEARSSVWGNCHLRLYKDAGCKIEIGSATNDWNIPRFSQGNDDKLSSYEIDCI